MTQNRNNILNTLRIHEVPHGASRPPGPPGAVSPPVAAPGLGPLGAFMGIWSGSGFNTIFRPNSAVTPTILPNSYGTSDNVLELNLTAETLTFSPNLGSVPNRGSLAGQADLFLNGIPYVQSIEDVTIPASPVGIHFEPGMWLNVGATANPAAQSGTVVRMGSIPHGVTIQAQGTSNFINGAPTIPAVDITPFTIGQPGAKNSFPSQTATNTATARIPQTLPATVTQAMLSDPNSVLRAVISTQNIIATTVLTVSTIPLAPLFGGGTDNIAFLLGNAAGNPANANAVQMAATFWIETVKNANGSTFQQLQYSQMVLLNFGPLSWPHVSVGTLVQAHPTFAIQAPNQTNFLTLVNEGGFANGSTPIQTNATSVGANEKFTLQWINQGAGTFALCTPGGNFLTVVNGGGVGGPNDASLPIHSDATTRGPWETLSLVPQFDGTYAIQSATGFYLTATNGGGVSGSVVSTTATTIGANETLTMNTI